MENYQANILVVDDNLPEVSVIIEELGKERYCVKTAKSGERALKMIEQTSFDLVLLDIEMPGMSGLEVLECIRAKFTRFELPVIMTTSDAKGDRLEESLSLGAIDY